jgi:hypothetical protein
MRVVDRTTAVVTVDTVNDFFMKNLVFLGTLFKAWNLLLASDCEEVTSYQIVTA